MAEHSWAPTLRLDARGLARMLGELEAEIMKVIWQRGGETTIREVCDQLSRPLAFNTVMTVMNTLTRKGLLIRRGTRRAYRYRAAMDQDTFTSQVVQKLFTGLLEDFGDIATAGFLEAAEVVHGPRLKELIRKLEETGNEDDRDAHRGL